jgi:hypothetical protein
VVDVTVRTISAFPDSDPTTRHLTSVIKLLLLAATAAAALQGSVTTERERLHVRMVLGALEEALTELREMLAELTRCQAIR